MRKVVLIAVVAIALGPLALGGTGDARKEYLERSKKIAAEDVKEHYLLGLWCREKGLDEEARIQFERVVALSPDHAGARDALGYVRHQERWLSHDEAMREKGLVRHEGVWMLPEAVRLLSLPADERARKRDAEQRTRKLLKNMLSGGPKVERIAVQAMAGIPDRYKLDPLAYGLRYPKENVRIFAAKELGRIAMRTGDKRALQPLIFRSVIDPSERVREAAVSAVKGFDDPNLIAPFVKAMFSDNQAVRINAARAVGELGDVRGIEYLVWRLRAHGGGLTRSHIYLATQLSFIQDFDVEVAQTAFIADPIVGILQEGQVLDVRVLATERTADILERRVIRGALKKLTKVDMGDSPEAWAKWWQENKSEYASSN